MSEIDWKRVKALIEQSELHSRQKGECLTEDEWRFLAKASGHDRERYKLTLVEVTKKP